MNDRLTIDREPEDKLQDNDRWYIYKEGCPIAGPGTGAEMREELDLIERGEV